MSFRTVGPFIAFASMGCAQILGLDDFTNASGGTGGVSVGGSGGIGVGGSGGAGASTTDTTSSGGSGSCVANTEMRGCYDGPMGTEGVGLCKGGMQTCGSDGMWPLDCPDDVVPLVENGQSAQDEDCVLNVGEYTKGALLRAYSDLSAGEPEFVSIAGVTGGDAIVSGHLVLGSLALGGAAVSGDDDAGGFFWARLNSVGDAVWARSLGITGVNGYGRFVGPFVFGVAGSSGVDLGDGIFRTAGTPVLAKYDLSSGAHIFSVAGVPFDRAATFGNRLCGTVVVGASSELRCYVDNGTTLQLVLTKPLGANVRVNAIWMNDANVVLAGELQATTTFGTKTLTVSGTSDAFVTMVSTASGMFRTSEQLGVATGTGKFTQLDVDGGGLFVGGTFSGMLSDGTIPVGNIGAVLSRFAYQNSGFTPSWTKAAGFPVSIDALSADSEGNVVASFQLSTFTDFGGGDVGTNGSNFALAAFDAAGKHLWSRTTDVVVNSVDAFAGSLLAAGIYFGANAAADGATPFGTGAAFPPGGQGVFLGRLERIPF